MYIYKEDDVIIVDGKGNFVLTKNKITADAAKDIENVVIITNWDFHGFYPNSVKVKIRNSLAVLKFIWRR